MRPDHEINTYIITSVKKEKDTYDIKYGGNCGLTAFAHELNFVPKKGQKIVVGLVNTKVTTIMINGRKVR